MAEKRALSDATDEELVQWIAAGDAGAFASLVDRHKRGVCFLAARMVGAEEAEDLAQDVFLRAYRALPAFRGASSFRTWLYRIARNHCLSELRKGERRAPHLSIEEEGDEKVHALLPEPPEGLEAAIEKKEVRRRVRALVDRLPDSYRTALTLFYLNELKYDEVADTMEIPLGTVKTLIHRARLRLRDLVVADIGRAEEPGIVAKRTEG